MLFYVVASTVLVGWIAVTGLCLRFWCREWLPLPTLLVLVPAALSLAAFVTRWTWPAAALIPVVLLLLPGLITLGMLAKRRGAPGVEVPELSDLKLLVFLLFGFSLLYLGILFLFGPQEDMRFGAQTGFLPTATTRFTAFSSDSLIPHLFAEGLRAGDVPSPLIGDWNSSDRPPLQTGYVLLTEPLLSWIPGYKSELGDPLAGMFFQLLWVPAAWQLVKSAGPSRAPFTATVGVCALGFTGSTFINTTYTWPKMGAAALLIVAACLLWGLRGHKAWSLSMGLHAGLAGVATILSLLAHGTAVFGALALLIISAVVATRSMIRYDAVKVIRAVGCFVGAGAIVYLPWLLYPFVRDEASNRLIKFTLAGEGAITDHGLVRSIELAYQDLSLAQWIEDRWSNVTTLLPSTYAPDPAQESGPHRDWIGIFHTNEGYRLAGALVWLLPWVVAGILLVGRRLRGNVSEGEKFAAIWWIATLALWVVLMFPAGLTTMNTAPLTLTIIPMALVPALVASLRPVTSLLLLLVQGSIVAALATHPGIDWSDSSLDYAAATTAITGMMALAGVLAVAERSALPIRKLSLTGRRPDRFESRKEN